MNDPKPGNKTTEFWLVAITNAAAALIMFLQASGKVTPDQGQELTEHTQGLIDTLSQTIPLIVMALVNTFYAWSRALVKRSVASVLLLLVLVPALTGCVGLHSKAITRYHEHTGVDANGHEFSDYKLDLIASGAEIEEAMQSMNWQYGKDKFLRVGNDSTGMDSTAVAQMYQANFAASIGLVAEVAKAYVPVFDKWLDNKHALDMQRLADEREIRSIDAMKPE